MISTSRSISHVASGPVSVPFGSREATSVSRTAGSRATWSSEVAVTLGVNESQEVLELLIKLEGVGSQLVQRPHWPGVLGRKKLRHRHTGSDRRVGRAPGTRGTHHWPHRLPLVC
jgi:hypothetical protein